MTPQQAILLQMEALEWVREYYGSKLQPPRPRLGMTKGTPEFKVEPEKCLISINPRFPDNDILVSAGEEAGHYWHYYEQPALLERLETLTDILNHGRAPESEKERAVLSYGKLVILKNS